MCVCSHSPESKMAMVCQEVIVFVLVKEQQSVCDRGRFPVWNCLNTRLQHRVRAQEISDILTATGGSQIKTVVVFSPLPPSPSCRVGGSVPVIFSYFSEFMPRLRRGAMISCLATFWMGGNIVAAGGNRKTRILYCVLSKR